MRRKSVRPQKRIAALIESLEHRMLLAGNPTVIDLLTVYTPWARDDAGSDAAIKAMIQESVDATNQAFMNSQINAVIRLVHSEEISYDSNGDNAEDLDRLKGTSDGYMDSVHALRNTLGADLVSLISTDGNGGIANLLHDVNYPSLSTLAFSVIDITAMNAGNLTMTHELGHNLGGGHERGNVSDPAVGPFPYSYGHRFYVSGVAYHDIMSYDPGLEVPYFANPLVSYKGTPTGSAAGNPDSADIVSTFAQTIPLVTNYRATAVTDTLAPTATVHEMRRAGNVLTFTVRYRDEIAVDASSIDAFDVRVSAPGGLSLPVELVSVDSTDNAFARKATYRTVLPASLSSLAPLQFELQAGQVKDINNNAAGASVIPIRGGDTAMGSMAAARDLGELTSSLTLSESASPDDYYDFYSFTIGSTTNVALSMTGLSTDMNASLVYDANGNGDMDWPTEEITSTWNPGISDDRSIVAQLTPGTYYVVIFAPQDGVSTGLYTMTLESHGGDFTPPTATLDAVDVTTSVPYFDVAVTYSDDNWLDGETVRYNAAIRFEDQFGGWFYVYPDSTLNAQGWPDVRSRTIYYRVDKFWEPGMNWSSADNALYTVKIEPTANPRVHDTSGNNIPLLTLGTFRIAIGQSDTTAPKATLGKLTPVDAGAGTYEFTVTYQDNRAIDASTIDGSDIRVTGPGGFDQIAQFVSVSAAPTIGSSRVAIYRINAPGGVWDSSDNGVYSIALQSAQVRDTANLNVPAATLGSLSVAINHFTVTAANQVTLTLATLGNVTLDSLGGKTYFLVGDQLGYVTGAAPRTSVVTSFQSPVRVTSDIAASFAGASAANVSVLRNAVLTLDADSHVLDLTLDPAAKLNLADKALAIRTHGGNVSTVLDKLTGYLRSARNNGAWTGPGIGGTGATSTFSPVLIPNRDTLGGQLLASFAGAAVDADALLLKLSPTGDTDLNGRIDIDDYFRIDLGYALAQSGYHNGNFNYSAAGVPDGDDYFLIDASFLAQGPLSAGGPDDVLGEEEAVIP